MNTVLAQSSSSLTQILLPFQSPAMIGGIGLVLAGAALVGVVVNRWLSPNRDALGFAMVAAFAFTAALAYAGVPAAGAIVWVLLIILALVWIVVWILSALFS